MRRAFLVLLAITMVASVAFAQVQVEYDLSGEASATFGVNLDGNSSKEDAMTGFSVATDSDLEITFIEEMTEEFGEGDVYGWMEIEDFQFVVNDEDNLDIVPGDISAKVFMGPAYIVVATADTDVDEAEFGLNVDESIIDAGTNVGNLEGDDASYAGSGVDVQDNVVAVGFMVPDLLKVELSLNSYGDWTENVYNNYGGGVYVEATVAGFTVAVDATTTLRGHTGDVNDSESAGDFGDFAYLGIGVDYEMPLNDMITLKPYLGVDVYNNSSSEELEIEVVGGANAEWGADDLEVFAAASDETQAGFGVEFGYKTNNATQDWLWVRLGFAEEDGDDGLLPVIGAALLVEFAQASSDTAVDGTVLSFGAEADADLGVISPFFGMMYADLSSLSTDGGATDAAEDAGLTVKVGTDIDVIPATTFTIAWNSSDLLNDADAATTVLDDTYAYEAARGASDGQLGTFTIATKVEY